MKMKPLERIGSILLFGTLTVVTEATFAAPVTLDFSSGIYSTRPPLGYVNQYQEDGFTVATQSALNQFSTVGGTYGPTLAWYESGVVIRIDRGGALFNLDSVFIPVPAYAGLRFQSSTGAVVTVGSISGTLTFADLGWSGIDYFTVRTSAGFNILTQLDNVVVNSVPLPATLPLLLSGLVGLVAMRKRRIKPVSS